ncbi:diguanylate cyclase, partial [bacterium]|nr:diguanylate cyclase [bacterium]
MSHLFNPSATLFTSLSVIMKKQSITSLLSSLLLFVFMLCSTSLQAATLNVKENPNAYIMLLPHSSVLYDEQGELSLEQVTSKKHQTKFTPLSNNDKRFYQEPGTYWFKFTLKNEASKHLTYWLECDNHHINFVTLYSMSNNEFDIQKSGDHHVNSNWKTQERLHTLRLQLNANETKTFYLRVQSNNNIHFGAKLYSDHAHVVHFSNINVQLGIIYGILLALLIYSLNLYISLKDTTFLYFIATLLTVAIQVAANQGTFKVLVPGYNDLIDHARTFGLLANVLATAFFIRRFLTLAFTHPWLDKIVLIAGAAPTLIIGIFSLSPPSTDTFIIICGTLSLLVVMYCSFIRLREGYRPALFPLIGGLTIFIPMNIFVLLPESFIPSLSINSLLNILAVANMIVLTCGLSSRIDNINKMLNIEVSQRKKREQNMLLAQKIARYSDWSWNPKTDTFKLSANTTLILPHLKEKKYCDLKTLFKHTSPVEQHLLFEYFLTAAQKKSGFDTEFSLTNNQRTNYFHIQADFQQALDENDNDILIGTIHDITEKKLADFAYKENEQRWRDLSDATFEAIIILQEDLIIDANKACADLLGYAPKQLIGGTAVNLFGNKTIQLIRKEISHNQENVIETAIEDIHNDEISVELRCKNGKFNDKPSLIIAITNISERKAYEEKLRKMGYYDSLTGLANRTLFQERLQHAISKSHHIEQKHAILFIDLDQFKHINDSLGHEIGDQLLIQVARRFESRVRDVDTAARLGGDEFAMLIEDISAPYAAAKIADELIDALSEHIQIEEYNLLVTPSIGISMYPADGDTDIDLLRKADTAMYHAKSEGRNNFQFYTEQLNEKIVRRMDLESELRLAIEREELFLHYQPKVDLTTGDITGAEALLRWNSQKYGSVSPA